MSHYLDALSLYQYCEKHCSPLCDDENLAQDSRIKRREKHSLEHVSTVILTIMATSRRNNDPVIPVDHTTPTPRYSVADDTSLNAGIEYLNEHGYAVFSDVLSADEVTVGKELLWQFLEGIPSCSIRRNDPRSWSTYW